MLQRETRWASPCCNTSAIVKCFPLRRGGPQQTIFRDRFDRKPALSQQRAHAALGSPASVRGRRLPYAHINGGAPYFLPN